MPDQRPRSVHEAADDLQRLIQSLPQDRNIVIVHISAKAVPEPSASAAPAKNTAVPDEFRNAVLQALRDEGEPMKGRTIANRIGRKFNSHFRTCMSQMFENHDISLTHNGYTPLSG